MWKSNQKHYEGIVHCNTVKYKKIKLFKENIKSSLHFFYQKNFLEPFVAIIYSEVSGIFMSDKEFYIF